MMESTYSVKSGDFESSVKSEYFESSGSCISNPSILSF